MDHSKGVIHVYIHRVEKAIDDRDTKAWIKICHDDYIFVRHQSGTKMNREEFWKWEKK